MPQTAPSAPNMVRLQTVNMLKGNLKGNHTGNFSDITKVLPPTKAVGNIFKRNKSRSDKYKKPPPPPPPPAPTARRGPPPPPTAPLPLLSPPPRQNEWSNIRLRF